MVMAVKKLMGIGHRAWQAPEMLELTKEAFDDTALSIEMWNEVIVLLVLAPGMRSGSSVYAQVRRRRWLEGAGRQMLELSKGRLAIAELFFCHERDENKVSCWPGTARPH